MERPLPLDMLPHDRRGGRASSQSPTLGDHMGSYEVDGAERAASSGGPSAPRERLLHRLLRNLNIRSGDALALIQRDRVTVNDHLQRMDRWVRPGDQVAVNGHAVEELAQLTLVVHKPPGHTLTEEDPLRRPTYVSLLPDKSVVVRPAGRLDVGSSGLLLMTNRRDLAAAVGPRSGLQSAFIVLLQNELTPRQSELLRNPGLYGKYGAPVELQEGKDTESGAPALRFVVRGGTPASLRRALTEAGCSPVRAGICCTELGPLSLDDDGELDELGSWRYVGGEEVDAMLAGAVHPSGSEQQAGERSATATAG